MKTKILKSTLQIIVVAFALTVFVKSGKELGKSVKETWRNEGHTLTTRSFVNLLNQL